MNADAHKGPKRRITAITDRGARYELRYFVTLSCGHDIKRAEVTHAVGGMKRCPECAKAKEATRPSSTASVNASVCSRCGGSGNDPEIANCRCDCCAGTGREE